MSRIFKHLTALTLLPIVIAPFLITSCSPKTVLKGEVTVTSYKEFEECNNAPDVTKIILEGHQITIPSTIKITKNVEVVATPNQSAAIVISPGVIVTVDSSVTLEFTGHSMEYLSTLKIEPEAYGRLQGQLWTSADGDSHIKFNGYSILINQGKFVAMGTNTDVVFSSLPELPCQITMDRFAEFDVAGIGAFTVDPGTHMQIRVLKELVEDKSPFNLQKLFTTSAKADLTTEDRVFDFFFGLAPVNPRDVMYFEGFEDAADYAIVKKGADDVDKPNRCWVSSIKAK